MRVRVRARVRVRVRVRPDGVAALGQGVRRLERAAHLLRVRVKVRVRVGVGVGVRIRVGVGVRVSAVEHLRSGGPGWCSAK